MSSLFKKKETNENVTYSPRASLEKSYRSVQSNLLIAVAFTVVNILMLVLDGDAYFLFSIFVPYDLVLYGMYVCGMFGADFYYPDIYEELLFYDKSFFYVLLILAVAITLLYLVAGVLSNYKKRRVGWLIFALVMMVIDSISMLVSWGISIDNLMDIVFHAWIIVILSLGVRAHFALNKLGPEDEETVEQTDNGIEYDLPDNEAQNAFEDSNESAVAEENKETEEALVGGEVSLGGEVKNSEGDGTVNN